MNINVAIIKSPASAIGCTALASVIFALNVYVSSYAWKKILEFLHGKKIPYGDIRDVYVKSNIAKYLPGNVMHFAGRNALGARLGFGQLDMALSTVIEALILIITAGVWSLIFAYKSFKEALKSMTGSQPWVVPIIIAAAIAAVIIASVILYKKGYLQKYKKLLSLKFLRLSGILFLIYSLTMLIPGFILVLMFTKALGISLSLSSCVIIVAAYMISWILGYVVPGAPGGLGVREAVLLLVLKNIAAGDLIMVAILLHRLASIIGDVIAFFTEIVISKFYNKKG